MKVGTVLKGDIGRSIFAGIVCTTLFAVLVPFLGDLMCHLLWLPNEVCLVKVLAFFVVCSLACLIPMVIPRGRVDLTDKAVLITGCDTGFGLLLAKQLDALGVHVFAGCLLKDKGGSGAKELTSTCSDRTHVIQLDVTSDEEVDKAVKYISANIPNKSKGLWGIVNNAGASAFGEVEWSSIELYQRVADVNIWGIIRITKACLPLIRQAQGRVVMMTSGLGRMMAPSRSVYGLTKWALQGFSDSLRYEMKPFGVKVSMLEPGNYIAGTNIFTKQSVKKLSKEIWSKMTDDVKSAYGKPWFDSRIAEMEGYCNAGMSDLTPVVDAYEDALFSRFPLIRYQPMEAYWTIRSFVFTHFPSLLSDYWYIYRNAKSRN